MSHQVQTYNINMTNPYTGIPQHYPTLLRTFRIYCQVCGNDIGIRDSVNIHRNCADCESRPSDRDRADTPWVYPSYYLIDRFTCPLKSPLLTTVV